MSGSLCHPYTHILWELHYNSGSLYLNKLTIFFNFVNELNLNFIWVFEENITRHIGVKIGKYPRFLIWKEMD